MNESLIREKIHRAVDVHGSSMKENPYLAQRILAQTNRKEAPHMKKLSTGMIIAIVLMLLSVTAVAVGLTVEEIWQQSFEKMNTTGDIWNIGEPTAADLPLEEAAAIAREAIQSKFGVTDEELDTMGFYPTYIQAEVDHGTAYPPEWRFFWSSRTNVDLDLDSLDHGPLGEYRVYMHAETGEVDTCLFYTNDFWTYAQRIWDCGSYDEVYWNYQKPEFYAQSIDKQQYWEKLLTEQGYELIVSDEKNLKLLKSNYLSMLYYESERFLDPSRDVQAAVAWDTIERTYGYDAALLKKHGYVAVRSDFHTETDDIFISFNYHVPLGTTSLWADQMASDVTKVGAFMVSFYPGSDEVARTTHMPYSYWNPFTEPVTKGLLYEQTDWDGDDLAAFSEAFALLDRAMKRMSAAGYYEPDMEPVARDFIRRLGGNKEWYPEAPAELNADQWFTEESEWDAQIIEPEMPYLELVSQYGSDERFWPVEMQALYGADLGLSAPREGDMTLEEATARALKLVIDTYGPGALDALGDYTVGCLFYQFENDGDCIRWHIYITDDPATCQNGYTVVIFQRNGEDSGEDQIKLITDLSNG